jgi:hypothetical protein
MTSERVVFFNCGLGKGNGQYYGVIMRCPKCNSRKFNSDNFNDICENCGFSRPQQRKTILVGNHQGGGDRNNGFVIKVPNSLRNRRFYNDNLHKGDKNIIIDYHNVAYKYTIITDNKNVHLPKIIKLKGWNKEQVQTDKVTIQRTPKSILIFLRKRIKTDISQLDTAVEEAEAVIHQEAMAFQRKYGIILGEPEPLSKEVKIEPAFVDAGTLFKGKVAKVVYNEGQVEFIDKKDANIHAKNFVENMGLLNRVDSIEHKMDNLAIHLNEQTSIMDGFSKNVVTHMEVLRNIGSGIKEFREEVSKINTTLYSRLWGKFTRWFRKKNK